MINLGNISNMVFTSNPPQWDEVWVCHTDKIRLAVRVHGENVKDLAIDIAKYRDVTDE